MGGAVDFVGDIVGGAGDILGEAADFGGDVIGGIGDVVGDVASNVDWEDAIMTYITSGGDPFATAFAATSFDEDIGVNPFSYYNPDTGAFSFMPGESGGIPVPETGIDWSKLSQTAVNYLLSPSSSGTGATSSPSIQGWVPAESYGDIMTNVLNSFLGNNATQSNLTVGDIFSGIGSVLGNLLTKGEIPINPKAIGEFLKEYPNLPPVVLAGLAYADQQRLNEMATQGYEQFQQAKQDFAQKIASGTTRALPTRPLAKTGGLMSIRNKKGGRIGFSHGGNDALLEKLYEDFLEEGLSKEEAAEAARKKMNEMQFLYDKNKKAKGGLMGTRQGYLFGTNPIPMRQNQAGVSEMDLRDSGGFIPPIGIKEKADDIPAMLSNNEFVFTADAVRNAGNGDVNRGAQRMYQLMKQLENGGRV